MMRALWTAGSGMMAQQFNVDVISNNLANVNTTSYKKERAEFKDLLYETMSRASVLDGDGKPVNLQVGHGSAIMSTAVSFGIGNMEKTDGSLDFAINGDAFFKVAGPNGTIYTRDGNFKLSVSEEGYKLVTADGYPVLDENDAEIILTVDPSKLSITDSGELMTMTTDGLTESLGQTIGMVVFPNPEGLEKLGGNNYARTSATGEPLSNAESENKSVLLKGWLESSNVQVVEEMVKLIIAQRAYEVNSKAVQSADDMLGMANNLKR